MAEATTPTRITLGSGNLYIKLFEGTVPELDTITTTENMLGYISGGATLEYKPEFYEAKDDLGRVSKTIITSEEATLKSGIMTFNGNVLNKLCDTARVSEDTEKHTRKVLIGGINNAKQERYVIVFEHIDKIDGNIWVVIVGQNQSGFSLAFAKDKETVIDAEFKALPQDDDGTLIQYIEADNTITAAAMLKETTSQKTTNGSK